MMQTIEGTRVYVVDINCDPKTLLPIHGLTEEEKTYQDHLDRITGGNRLGTLLPHRPRDGEYARALNHAIETDVITQPGKYGIYIWHEDKRLNYEIFAIFEDTLRKVDGAKTP